MAEDDNCSLLLEDLQVSSIRGIRLSDTISQTCRKSSRNQMCHSFLHVALSITGCFCQYSTEISSFHSFKRIALLVGDGGNILPQFLPLLGPYYEQKCVTSEYISLNVKLVLFLSWHGGLNFVGGHVLKCSHED